MDTDGTQEILARYQKMRKALVGASAVLENNADQRRSAFTISLGGVHDFLIAFPGLNDPKPLFAFRKLMSALWDLDQGTTVPLLRANVIGRRIRLPNRDFLYWREP
ncbi:hypothetical protein [Bradyrhizobium prioriisuperbiae]|uniref:hypothetical protein n=1 Tax=Bradyrhizobium prioriisuperbiae TaxID=2854389 RepID=UPI0028E829FD|nr:hypothetical protein [Bradyrhizobium prioritasuperba]